MMPPLLHLSVIHYKCFMKWRCLAKQKCAVKKQTNLSMSAVERYCLINEKMLCKILHILTILVQLIVEDVVTCFWNSDEYQLKSRLGSLILRLYEICKWNLQRDIVSAIASVCAVKCVNSFARRVHLFDVAATPIDVDSNILTCLAPSSLFQFRPKCIHLICSWYWLLLVIFVEIRSALLRSERNIRHRTYDGTDISTDKAKT